MKKLLTLSILVFLAASCATTENYEKILNSWLGDDADNLVSKWGPPTSAYPLANRGKVMEYVRARSIQTGGYTYKEPQTTYHSGFTSEYGGENSGVIGSYSGTSTTYVQKTTPVTTLNFWCKTRFTINSGNRITQWRWEGNDCAANPPE